MLRGLCDSCLRGGQLPGHCLLCAGPCYRTRRPASGRPWEEGGRRSQHPSLLGRGGPLPDWVPHASQRRNACRAPPAPKRPTPSPTHRASASIRRLIASWCGLQTAPEESPRALSGVRGACGWAALRGPRQGERERPAPRPTTTAAVVDWAADDTVGWPAARRRPQLPLPPLPPAVSRMVVCERLPHAAIGGGPSRLLL